MVYCPADSTTVHIPLLEPLEPLPLFFQPSPIVPLFRERFDHRESHSVGITRRRKLVLDLLTRLGELGRYLLAGGW
jgi:hypothetical protein